jgi:signal transduction histidine kinase
MIKYIIAMNLDWADFETIIADAVCSSPPASGILHLVERLQKLIGADASVLYLLHLEVSHFLPIFGDPAAIQDAPKYLDVDVIDEHLHLSFANSAIKKLQVLSRSVSIEGRTAIQLAVPVRRSNSCLGLLLLQRGSDQRFSKEDQSLATIVADTIIPLIEKQNSLQLLQAVQKPINFHQPLHVYLDDLLLLIADASGMPMIAIREMHADSQALRCIAKFGLKMEKSELDLEPVDKYGPFRRAMNSKKPIAFPDASHEDARLGGFLDRTELDRVRSYVIAPILVGDSIFGTLSFAAGTRYNYSSLEIVGFETIANVIGTSITNYRNAQTVSQLYKNDGEVAFGSIALEVAQAARHEARNFIESVSFELANLLFLASKPRENSSRIQEKVEQISNNVQEIDRALNKIRDVSKPPKRELMTVSLKTVISEAAILVSGKIDKERVNVRPSEGKDIELEVYPERLRHAFLNLFLNSLDAFAAKKKQSGREIVIQIDIGSPSSEEVRIRYADNATGIDPVKLIVPQNLEVVPPVNELVFLPGVTSKPKGSGHGLFLVRRIIDEHDGSIDLVDYRNGVVFEIRLPKKSSNKNPKRSA